MHDLLHQLRNGLLLHLLAAVRNVRVVVVGPRREPLRLRLLPVLSAWVRRILRQTHRGGSMWLHLLRLLRRDAKHSRSQHSVPLRDWRRAVGGAAFGHAREPRDKD
jgi:hypothetical protein